MPAGDKNAAPFKDRFNEPLYRRIAQTLAAIEPGFDRKKFLAMTLGGIEGRELMDRLRQTAIAAGAALPGTYREKLAVLCQAVPRFGEGFVAVSFCDFVARFGLDDFDHSLETLRFLTPFGSAEFAVRPFIAREPSRALATLQTWALDKDEHVRRLASEGSRPRLPWGARLTAIVENPDLTAPILEALKADPAPYVRKSVANHLNDITKDHPDWVLDRVEIWDRTQAGTAWIVRHALRTLVKKGDPRALALFGADTAAAAHVQVRHFTVSPARLALGGPLMLATELVARGKEELPLVIDYIVHYARPGGAAAVKVFKWAEVRLLPGQPLVLTKRQTIRDFTTRKHHPGRHTVELQVNGQRLARTTFQLVVRAKKTTGTTI